MERLPEALRTSDGGVILLSIPWDVELSRHCRETWGRAVAAPHFSGMAQR